VLVRLAFFRAADGTARGASACQDRPMARGLIPHAYAAEADATLQYFGHNFFQLTTGQGTTIVMDPLAPGRYPTPNLTPHVVTVRREHPNHNYVHLAQRNPIILTGPAKYGAEWNPRATDGRE